MEVILKKFVTNLGRVGEVVTVKSGYARNFLVPKGYAMQATKTNIAAVEAKLTELKAEEAKLFEEANVVAEKLASMAFEFSVNTHDDGKLFGSVGAQEIIALAAENGIDLDRKQVHLVDGQIRKIGEYALVVSLFGGTNVDLVCRVTSSNVTVVEAESHDANEAEETAEDDQAGDSEAEFDVSDAEEDADAE